MTDPSSAPAAAQPYAADDPTVVKLARFLNNTPLANGTFLPVVSPMAELLAQAICNWTQDLVYSSDVRSYVARARYEADPELGDIEIESLADGQVVRMTHRSTSISALGESHEDAWNELRQKVRLARGQ